MLPRNIFWREGSRTQTVSSRGVQERNIDMTGTDFDGTKGSVLEPSTSSNMLGVRAPVGKYGDGRQEHCGKPLEPYEEKNQV